MNWKFLKSLMVVLVISSKIITAQSFQKGINFNYGYGTLVAHRNAMNHMVKGNSHYFDLTYTLRTTGKKESHSLFNYPWFGFGANFMSSGNPEQIGWVGGIYTFGILRLTKHPDFPLRFKIGAGLGYVQHTFDLQTNNQAIAIGSHLNSNMVFKFEKNFPIHSTEKMGSEVNVGFGLTHFSNGSFKSPNLGLNFVTLNLGYQLGFTPFVKTAATVSTKEKSKNELSLLMGIGTKQQSQPTYPNYFIGQTKVQFERFFNAKNSGFVSADFVWNESLAINNKSRFQQGLFFGYMLNFDRVRFGTGIGFYTINRTFDEQLLYHKLIIDYRLWKQLYLQLSMRTHWATADFVSLNLRYRLWKK